MKIKKFNKKEYLAVAASFVLVAVVGVGLSAALGDKEPQISTLPNNNTAANLPANEAQVVDSNKNAPNKIDEVDKPKENDIKEPVKQITNEEQQKELDNESDDKTVFEDEFDEVALMENEITFAWPLKGEIALNFSTDKTVFDPTLEQFRTNDAVCILADQGSDVRAAGDGTVAKIFTDYEKGVTIVINHRDGWSTTYSQLNEEAAVKVGEAVEKGQKIGEVAKPTKFSSALGPHLEFKLNQGEFAVNPSVAINE